VKPSDMMQLVRRIPARSLRKRMQDSNFGQKMSFLMNLCDKQSIKLTEVPEFARVWINESQKQPAEVRYFHVEKDRVYLTKMGEATARALKKKLSQ